MVTLYMANVKTLIHGLPSDLMIKLGNIVSYEVGGFGAPKEKKSLIDIQTSTTYTGVVPRVLLFLKQHNIQYKVVDRREVPKQNTNYVIQKPFEARDYQAEIINGASSREIIQAATGAGKTFIMASLIAKHNVKPIIVIAPKVSLAEQIQEEFSKFLGTEIGIVGGGQYDIKDITVSTPMSAPKELLENAKMIMFDEAHNIPANNIFKCAAQAKNAYYRFGVSATPWRDSGDDILIEAVLSIRKPHLSINASKLIKKGKLTPCNIVFVPIKQEFEWEGSYHKLYTKAIIENEVRNNMIVKLSTHMMIAKSRTVLILIKNIEHGDRLLKSIRTKINNQVQYTEVNGQQVEVQTAEFLSGRDDATRRKAVLKAVKEKKTKILIGSTIADEGLDLPILDCLILAGSGKSSTRAFQRVGRVIRLYTGKKDAIVFDFMDETKTFKRHALIREALYRTEPEWKITVLKG